MNTTRKIAGIQLVAGLALIVLLSAAMVHSAEFTPLNLTLEGSLKLDLPNPVTYGEQITTDLFLSGDYAYLGAFGNTLHIIDISRPAAMREVARVQTPGPVVDVMAEGNLVAIAVQDLLKDQQPPDFGVVLVDISDPPNPKILAEFSAPGWGGVHNLFLYKERVYLAHHLGSKGLTILNISDPTHPFVSGHWENEGKFGNSIHDVFIRDHMAVLSVIAQGGLVILDLTDPDRPSTLSSLPIRGGGSHNAWMEGNYVYCNQEIFGWLAPLYIVDVSDPSNPVEVRQFRAQPPPFSPIEGPHNSWIQDGLLYWAYYDAGLRVLDISVPDRPVEIGYHPAVSAWGAQPHTDGLVYVADSGLGGLLALRFHDPAHVVKQVSLTPDVAVSGQDNSIKVMASTTPSPRGVKGQIARVSARFFNYGDAEEGVLLDDGASGDAAGGDGIFNGRIQVPTDQPNGRYRLRIQAEDDQGRIYPYEVPFRVLPPEDMVIFGETLAKDWTAAPATGVEQMDLQNQAVVYQGQFAQALEVDAFNLKYSPANPIDSEGYTSLRFAFHPGDATVVPGGSFNVVIRYQFRPGGFALRMGETERYLNVKLLGEDVEEGMSVRMEQKEWQVVGIPLTFPEAGRGPIQILEIRFGGKLQGTFYLDDLRLVAERPPQLATAVLENYASSRPQHFSLSQNFPNPFNSNTAIRFELPESGEVELEIFNLAGQQVAALAQGAREAGAYTLRWDGKDDSGKELASGVYLYRLRVGERMETRKLVLVR